MNVVSCLDCRHQIYSQISCTRTCEIFSRLQFDSSISPQMDQYECSKTLRMFAKHIAPLNKTVRVYIASMPLFGILVGNNFLVLFESSSNMCPIIFPSLG